MVQIEPYESNYFLDSDKDPSIIPLYHDENENEEERINRRKYAESYDDFRFREPILQSIADLHKRERPNRMHAIGLRMMTSIPYRNLLAQARFASKIYECYVLTILDRISIAYQLQAIVMCPTIELANKINDQILKIGKFSKWLQSRVVVEGPDIDVDIGLAHIVIGLPSTIQKLTSMRKLDLSHMMMIVIEKTDQIVELSMGADTQAVVDAVEAVHPDCQVFLLYGTLSDKLRDYATKFLDNGKWDQVFVNREEYCIWRLKMFHVSFPNEEQKALAIREILDLMSERIQIIIYVDPKTNLKHLQKALLGLSDIAYVPELLKPEDGVDHVHLFKTRNERVLITCVPPTTGFDRSKVHLLIFHDIPMIRANPDYECYYRLAAQVGRNMYEDEWADEIGGLKGYCVLHLLSEKQDELMTKIECHFGRSVPKMTDDICRGVSHVERALELACLVPEFSSYVSSI